MKRIFTVCLLLTVTSTFGQLYGTWTKKADMSTLNRESAVGFTIGTKGYIGLGNVGGSPNGALWEYNYTFNSWTQKANMSGGGRVNPVAFVLNGYAYVGTGENNMFTRDKKFYAYDPLNNVWTAKADFGGTARTEAVAFTIGSKGYVGTGYDGTRRKDFWEYDAVANTWTQKADFGGTARNMAVGFAIGTKGYIGTGNDGSKKKDFWEYDQTSNTWTRKADFGGAARESAVGFALNSKGYIGTGDSGTGKNDIWEYDPTTDEWIQRANFTGQRRYVAAGFAISSSNKAYIGTGFTDEPAIGVSTKDFYEFAPPVPPATPTSLMVTAYTENSIRLNWLDRAYDETGYRVERSTNGTTFTTLVDLPANSATYTDNGLPTGQKYYYRVRATNTTNGLSAPADVVSETTGEPLNGIWTTLTTGDTNSPTIPTQATSFTLDGVIYLTAAGWMTNSVAPESSRDVWAYDPATGTFTQKAKFAGEARINAVGFALGGKGYVGTGQKASGSTNSVKDLWQYDPAANQWTQKADLSTVGRFNAYSFTIGNKAYVGGGNISSTGLVTKEFYEYNPASDTWTQKADYTVAAGQLKAIGYQGKGYVMYGFTMPMTLYQYDPAANTWTSRIDFPIAAYGFKGFSILNDRFYAATYTSVPPYKSTLWELELASNRWIERAQHAEGSQYSDVGLGTSGNALYQFSQTTVFEYSPDHQVRVPAGINAEVVDPERIRLTWFLDSNATATQILRSENESGPFTQIAVVPASSKTYTDEYPATEKSAFYQLRAMKGTSYSKYSPPVQAVFMGAWKQLKNFDATSFATGEVMIASTTRGYIGVSSSRNSWTEYNPENDSWTKKQDFPGELRTSAGSFVINDKIYVGFGLIYDGQNLKNKVFRDLYMYDPVTDIWTKKNDFPGEARTYVSVTSGNGKAYLIGGDANDGAATFLNDVWEYTPESDTWSRMADFPIGIASPACFVRDNKLWALNGMKRTSPTSSQSVSQAHTLDLATGVWTKLANPPGYSSGKVALIGDEAYFSVAGMVALNLKTSKWTTKPYMPGAQYSPSSFSVNGAIYGVNSKYEVWTYIPDAAVAVPDNLSSQFLGDRITLSWTSVSTRPVKTEIQYKTSANQSDYSTLAITPIGATQFTLTNLVRDSNYKFRIISITEKDERSRPSSTTFQNTGPNWTELPNVPATAARSGFISFAMNSKIYFGTGRSGDVYMKDLWEYDITSGVWTQKADLSGVERYDATTFVLGNDAYVGFGASKASGQLKDLYKYTPATNTWTASVSYPNNNSIQSPGVFVSSGKAYLVGGLLNGTFNSINELWSFDGVTWTQLTSLPGEPRRSPIAFASNGKAYIGGGQKVVNGSYSYVGNDFYEYTVSTDSWKKLTSLPGDVMSTSPSYTSAGGNKILVFYTSSNNTSGIQVKMYDTALDKWSNVSSSLTIDYLTETYSVAHDLATGLSYAIMSHAEYGLRFWRFDYQPDGPNLVDAAMQGAGMSRLKWRKISPQPDSVVIFRSNQMNVLGTRQSAVRTSDTTATNSVQMGQTYYYSIRSYSNSGQFKTSAQRVLVVDNLPAAPIELTGALVGEEISLSWTAGDGPLATKYVVERASGGDSFVKAGESVDPWFRTSDLVAATMRYRVKAVNGSGESAYSNIVDIIVTGIEDEKSVTVYPNPTTDFITVEVNGATVSMQLLDINGRKLMARELTSTSRIDLSAYSPGIYFVSLASTHRAGNKYIKIIKK